MTCPRYRRLLTPLKLNDLSGPCYPLRPCGFRAVTLSQPGLRRCYASATESSVTEVERILLDTIEVCISLR